MTYEVSGPMSEKARGKQRIWSNHHDMLFLSDLSSLDPESPLDCFYNYIEQFPSHHALREIVAERFHQLSLLEVLDELEKHPKERLLKEIKSNKIDNASLRDLLRCNQKYPKDNSINAAIRTNTRYATCKDLAILLKMFPANFEIYKAFLQSSWPYTIVGSSKMMSELRESGSVLHELVRRRFDGLNIGDLSILADCGHLPTAMISKVKTVENKIYEEVERAEAENVPSDNDDDVELWEEIKETRKLRDSILEVIDPKVILPHEPAPPETHAERVKRLNSISEWRYIRKRKASVLRWTRVVSLEARKRMVIFQRVKIQAEQIAVGSPSEYIFHLNKYSSEAYNQSPRQQANKNRVIVQVQDGSCYLFVPEINNVMSLAPNTVQGTSETSYSLLEFDNYTLNASQPYPLYNCCVPCMAEPLRLSSQLDSQSPHPDHKMASPSIFSCSSSIYSLDDVDVQIDSTKPRRPPNWRSQLQSLEDEFDIYGEAAENSWSQYPPPSAYADCSRNPFGDNGDEFEIDQDLPFIRAARQPKPQNDANRPSLTLHNTLSYEKPKISAISVNTPDTKDKITLLYKSTASTPTIFKDQPFVSAESNHLPLAKISRFSSSSLSSSESFFNSDLHVQVRDSGYNSRSHSHSSVELVNSNLDTRTSTSDYPKFSFEPSSSLAATLDVDLDTEGKRYGFAYADTVVNSSSSSSSGNHVSETPKGSCEGETKGFGRNIANSIGIMRKSVSSGRSRNNGSASVSINSLSSNTGDMSEKRRETEDVEIGIRVDMARDEGILAGTLKRWGTKLKSGREKVHGKSA